VKILAIDTATEACSAALLIDGEVTSRYYQALRGHADMILTMVDELLADAQLRLTDLTCVAFGRGPGSFTGVRVATSVTQGLAYGAGLKVAAVSDLAALAQHATQISGSRAVLACIDARMKEVYWGNFELGADGLVSAVSEERVSSPSAVTVPWGPAAPDNDWVGAGTGWGSYPQLTERLHAAPLKGMNITLPVLLPRAHEVVRLAVREVEQDRLLAPEHAMPVYLRDTVAWVSQSPSR
jgi:tRNA threonylcarbamoyladenosine biosynthesis protein TsaB